MYIGIDIGGTKIALGILDEKLNLLARGRIATEPSRGPRSGIERINGKIEELLDQAGRNASGIRGIGIGCAGPVDPERGVIMNPYTLPGWENFPLTEELGQRWNTPVFLENDINAVILGEVALGGWQDREVLLFMVGTGVGVAMSHPDGSLHRTRSVYHPEMGHLIIEAHGPECYCGRRGCLESLASGTALHRIATEAGFGDFRNLVAEAEKGADRARELLEQAAQRLAAGLWNLQIVLHPEIIVLGGGIMGDFFSLFKEKILAHLPSQEDFNGHFTLEPSQGGDEAALLGAALLAHRQGAR